MIGARQVTRGVQRVAARTPTLPPATHTNSYALGDEALVLVEPATPYDDERREWVAWARGLAAAGRELRALLVTHHHVDHVGGAAFLARELGLPIWAHAATADRAPGFAVDRRLEDGERLGDDGALAAWRVLVTPGHAPGHVCLFDERSRALVAGDMVASEGTILIEPGDGDMAEYLRQLARLAALDAAVVLPAHGDPIDDAAGLFARYVAHRLGREAKVLAAVAARPGGGTLLELLPDAYADTPKVLWPIAKLSLEAHLVKLVADGRVRRDADRWVPSAPP